MGEGSTLSERRRRHPFLRRLGTLAVMGVVLVGSIGPLGAAPASAGDEDQAAADGERAYPNGRILQTTASPITVPAGGAGTEADASVGGPPLFLPYTPPADTTELADQRSGQSRTLANPDGTFTTEVSDGPINFKDANGAWQPIDLALVERPLFDGYEVAATAGDMKLGTADGALGSIEIDGHLVTLTPPTYLEGVKGEGADVNRVDFSDFSGTAPTLWIRPVDIGLEFGATWADASAAPSVILHLDSGDLTAALGKDDHSIIFTNEKGEFAGRIDFPILREGGEDGPPILDQVTVTLEADPNGGYALTYAIDAKWFEAPERVFPVILDPTWCIGAGASGCTDNTTSNSTDTFVYDDNPDGYESGWTVIRTGFDSRTDEGTYGKMRSILYFPQVALPDGAVIYDTDLQARIYSLFGASEGETITAYRLTKLLTSHYTWNKFGNAFDSVGAVADTVPASGYMNWDVDDIVTSFYTRRSKQYKPPYGFLLKMDAEGSTHGEVEFRRYDYGTTAYRPLLTISYTLPKVGIDFDPRLGTTYAPSQMVAGQAVILPIIVENKTGSADPLVRCDGILTDCWKVGYRWFDGKGNLVAVGTDASRTVDLPASSDPIAAGSDSDILKLSVTPPATTGQYTLALDLVHYRTGHYWWSSDFASPSLYYSRNKKILTSSSTRWTGSSAIERDEFSINVTEGAGGSNTQSVSIASGGSVGIDLATKNLSLGADTGLGFADRVPLSLTYGYNEALGEICAGYQGIIGACGWYTNWDERVIGGANQTGFDYSYVDPGGTPAMLDTDDSGQIAGGASVLFNRQRVTIFDENGGWDGVDTGSAPDIPAVLASGESPSIPAWSGINVAKSAATADVLVNAPDKVSLNVYRKVSFAMRTTAAAKAGMCFQIHNLSDSDFADRWFCYTLGDASWSAGNEYRFFSTSTLTTAWKYIDSEDLWDDVRNDGDYGGTKDDYQVIAIRVEGAPSATGFTYVDGFRFESDEYSILDESNPSNWTTGQSQTSASSDAKVGTTSIKVTPGSGIAPSCLTSNSCWGTTQGGTWVYPFADWYWKKAGGTSAAMVFYLHDERSGAHCYTGNDCTLTYYAGALPTFTPSGAYNVSIRIAPNLPTTWTLVRRNVAADAAQALNLFDDADTGTADQIRITGWAPVAVDGNNLLIDHFSYGNLPDTGTVDPTGPDGAGLAGQQNRPSTQGDTTFTHDFSADYADGSRHYFNRDGLLMRIRSRDQQSVTLDWSFDFAKAGPTAYSLTAIHSPTDATSSGSTTFNRQFTVARGSDGSLATIRFDEDLGSTGSDQSDRAAIFEVSSGPTPDLMKVSYARQHESSGATGTFCGSRPNGCVEYGYLTTTHRLQYVVDPRWDGGSGASDYRLEVGRTGNDPVSVLDKSHSNAALLKVLTFDDTQDTALRYTRARWQDAAAGAAGAEIATDLNPDGAVLTQYSPRVCTSGDCVAHPAPFATQSNYKVADYEYDGLSRVNTVKTYRCPVASDAVSGCPGGALVTMTRSESNASAKIDNYSDPLAGGRMAWRATADQVFASLRDSKGANADWYRTEYVYDGTGQVAETLEARQLDAAYYSDAVLLNSPTAYWRLGDSGSPMIDSSGFGRNGTPTSVTYAQDGAIVRDTNKAAVFNGSTSKVVNSAVTLSTTAYSIAGWVKASTPGQTSKAIFGRYLSNSGVKVYLKGTGAFGLQHNATLVSSTVVPVPGRWYYLVATWNGTMARLYVDGELVADEVDTSATGAGSSNFEIGTASNGSAGNFFAGSIDEVQVYASSLAAWRIAAHFRAGHAITTVDTTVQRDTVGRPTETATSFTINPGFEQHTNGWALGSGATITTTEKNSGAASVALATADTTQIAQLVPGQTFRLQYATRSSAGTASVVASIKYRTLGVSPTWQTMTPALTSSTNTTWQVHAYDITLPMATDGRVLISFAESGTGSAWLDDVLIVTHWGLVIYDQTPGISLGLPTTSFGLTTCAIGPCLDGTIDSRLVYAASTTSPNYHPAIFPTKTIANYDDGVQGPDAFLDVTTTTAYDSWGRNLVVTDPDGVKATTVFNTTDKTDVATTKDGLDAPTAMTYDTVGNQLTTTTPMGRASTATYDARNHRLVSTSPDGTKAQTDYDTYGRATASWANYVNGAVESSDSDLTDDILTKPTYDAFGHVVTTETDCGSVATCNSNGGLAAKSTATFDLLGNTVASTAYPGAAGSGSARTTTNYFETYDPPTSTEFDSAGVFSRAVASGVRLPIAPSAGPAIVCPGSSSYCNTVSTLDLSNRAIFTTDAYGIVTRTRYDVDGKPVEVTANYGDGTAGPLADDDVISLTEYDLAGNPATSWDPAGRREERVYDVLGRLIRVGHVDNTSPGVEYAHENTDYKASGRVNWTFDGAAYTRTIYDLAGRAIQTLRHFDALSTNARTRTDGFEDRTLAGWAAGSGWFTVSGASLTADTDYASTGPRTGRGRLRITTSASITNTGAYWNLAGPTFLAGHTYRLQVDVKGPAGSTLEGFLGVDASGGDYVRDSDADTAGSQSLALSGAWQAVSIEWTPATTTTGAVHFAIQKAAAGAISLYLDNVRFWDKGAGETDWNIPSSTVYDADGAPIASVMPPGDLRNERELVTLTGYDSAGRTTAVTANATTEYSHAINATGRLAYWPLDNLAGVATDEGASNDLTVTGPVARGVAGGPDDARGAYRFNGSSTYLSTSTLPTTAVDDVHMEAWFRYDAVPAADSVIAYNGDANTGWGLYIQSDGSLAVLFSGVGALDTSVTPAAGPWHYARYERLAGVEKLFLDGTERSLTNTTMVPLTPSGTFSVGRYNNAAGYRYFKGDIDEVAVWSKTTSITDHWTAGHKADAVSDMTTRNNYDALGRTVDAWDPAGTRTKAFYDRLGNQTETVANYLDGTTTGGTADDDVRSTFAYDVLGELLGYCPAVEVKVGGCDPASGSEVQAWHYGFDVMGRQTTTIAPDNTMVVDLTTEEVVYETGGRVAKTCRYPVGTSCGSINSRHTDFTYDDLGRILTQKTYDRGAGSDVLKFTKTMTWNADGSPATVNEGSDTLTYAYDTAGRVSQFKRSTTVLTSYTYTPDTSTIATRTDGTQGATTFTYDWARRQTVIDPPDAFVAGTVSRAYRLDGLLATQAFPSSITETLAYDEAKRPTSINLGTPGSLSQTFDRAGRITSDARSLTGISGDAGAGTQSFTYDSLSRLTGSTGLAINRSYQYDLDGNRTQRVEGATTTAYTYDRGDQVLKQTIGGVDKTYTYDRYGNLTQGADNANAYTTYAFDEANRLTGITPPSGGAVTFTLDALDRHATRLVSGSTTDTYSFLDATETAWQTGNGTPTSSLLDADGSRLAVKTGSTVSWLIFDLHGSVTAMCTSGTSTITDAYRFDGFGQQIQSSGTSANPWRFRGLLNIGADVTTGALLDMGARDYSPQLGVFTQQDSVQGSAANPMTMNRFLYALANPATLIDPDGHRATIWEASGGGSGVIVAPPFAPPSADAFKVLIILLFGVGSGGLIAEGFKQNAGEPKSGDQPVPWNQEPNRLKIALKWPKFQTVGEHLPNGICGSVKMLLACLTLVTSLTVHTSCGAAWEEVECPNVPKREVYGPPTIVKPEAYGPPTVPKPQASTMCPCLPTTEVGSGSAPIPSQPSTIAIPTWKQEILARL